MRSLRESSKIRLFSVERISAFLATGGLVGYLPPFPGTLGALEGLLLYYLTKSFPFYYHLVIFFLLSFMGIYTSKVVAELTGREDPDEVIIDEVCGAYLASLGKETLLELLFVFIIFRIIDIGKPYPLRKIEKVPYGLGIMLDDLVAGLFTNLLVFLIFFLWRYF